MDRVFLELQKTPEECYQTFLRIVESVNVLIAQFSSTPEEAAALAVDPVKGTVIFGSGLHQWGFGLSDFAQMFAPKFGVTSEELASRLWGEHFYNAKRKEWVAVARTSKGKPLKRGFVEFVLDPIYTLFTALMDEEDTGTAMSHLKALGVVLKGEQRELRGKKLYKAAMPLWLPMADVVLRLVVQHLPTPAEAQSRRVGTVYNGNVDDECGRSISRCDPSGPVVVYVAKMVPAPGTAGRFFAYARVFSGTLRTGDKIIVLGPNYSPGQKHDMFLDRSVQRIVQVAGKKLASLDSAPCGNIVGIFGVDTCLVTTGTLTSTPACAGIKTMKFSVSPVVQVAVAPTIKTEVVKLAEGLRRLVKTDNCVRAFEQEGQYIVAATGELHLEIVLSDLKTLAGVDITVSEPVVSYRETVMAPSTLCALSKSTNKHNRIWSTAEPLGFGLTSAIEEKDVRNDQATVERTRILREDYGWDQVDCKRIWCFGPDGDGPNVLVDTTKQVQYLHEVKDSVSNAFGWAAHTGVLCEEPLRGVRFNITDAKLHSQGTHRNAGQVLPAARRSFYAAMLTARPALLEPMFVVEIVAPEAAIGGVYSTLAMRRGRVLSQEAKHGSPQYVIRAYLPVAASFGFNAELKSNTAGQAFPHCSFDHWAIVDGDPLDSSTHAGQVVQKIRQRKGLPKDVPSLDKLLDKIGTPPSNPRFDVPPPPSERVMPCPVTSDVPQDDAMPPAHVGIDLPQAHVDIDLPQAEVAKDLSQADVERDVPPAEVERDFPLAEAERDAPLAEVEMPEEAEAEDEEDERGEGIVELASSALPGCTDDILQPPWQEDPAQAQ